MATGAILGMLATVGVTLAALLVRRRRPPLTSIEARDGEPFRLEAAAEQPGAHTVWLRYDVAYTSPFKDKFGLLLRVRAGDRALDVGVGRGVPEGTQRIGLTRFDSVRTSRYQDWTNAESITVCDLHAPAAGAPLVIEGVIEAVPGTTVRGLSLWISPG